MTTPSRRDAGPLARADEIEVDGVPFERVGVLVWAPRVTIEEERGVPAFVLTCRYAEHSTRTAFATLAAAIWVGRQVAMTTPYVQPVPGTVVIGVEP